MPEAGGQRFLIGQTFQYQTAVDAARQLIPELKNRLPEGIPGWKEDIYRVDGTKAIRVLGLKYGTLEETVKDTYSQLLRAEKAKALA